jgi:hypothetical protein
MTDPTHSAEDEIPETDDSFELASPSMTQTTAEADETNVPGESDLDESPSLEHDGEDNGPVAVPPRRPSEPIPLIFNPRARGNDYHGVKRFLVFASGARPEILAQCPTDEATHVGLGGTVVATSFLSGISMVFAMTNALGLNLFSALIAGFLWALIIFNLDRWLIVSQKRTTTPLKQWITVLPRVLVAVLLGFVISEPLLHEIFKSELKVEILDLQNERNTRALAKITDGSAARISEIDAEIAEIDRRGGGDSASEQALQKEIESLKKEITDAKNARDTATDAVRIEQEGRSASGRPGCADICRDKQITENRAQAELERIEAANLPRIADLLARIDQSRSQSADERTQRVAADAQTRANLNTERQKIDENKQKRIDASNSADEGNAGLLLNIEALHSLGSKNTSILVAHWLLFALFIALDTIPVIGKTLILTGPKRPYEQACDAIDSRLSQDAEQVVAEARIDREEHIDLLEEDAKLRVKVQSQNNEHFIRNAAKTQRDIGDLLLDRWRAEQISRVQQEINQQTPGDA